MTSDRDRRPRRNRVTPFGEIVATPHYGDLMGNRGQLHDEAGNIVRRFDREAWIACRPRWPKVRRTLMAPGRYTELFFLDEATALAAGHRPCGQCRSERLAAFKHAWARAYGPGTPPRAAAIDAVLAPERRQPRPMVDAAALPDGAIVTLPGTTNAWLKWRGAWRRWSFAGYGAPEPAPGESLMALTSPAMLAVLAAGYVPELRGLA